MTTGRARRPNWHGPGGKPGRKTRNIVITAYGWHLLRQMDEREEARRAASEGAASEGRVKKKK